MSGPEDKFDINPLLSAVKKSKTAGIDAIEKELDKIVPFEDLTSYFANKNHEILVSVHEMTKAYVKDNEGNSDSMPEYEHMLAKYDTACDSIRKFDEVTKKLAKLEEKASELHAIKVDAANLLDVKADLNKLQSEVLSLYAVVSGNDELRVKYSTVGTWLDTVSDNLAKSSSRNTKPVEEWEPSNTAVQFSSSVPATTEVDPAKINPLLRAKNDAARRIRVKNIRTRKASST